jgi:hypothetical protein
MAIEPSVQDRVLQTFLARLGEGKIVSPSLIARLSGLLSKGSGVGGDDFVRVIKESVSDDAEA